MTNYIVPSTTPTEEVLDLSGLTYPCRITDLRTGEEYVLETESAAPIALNQVTTPPAGDTAGRPVYTSASSVPYFDTTIGKPIWFNGTVWVDATGTDVDA